MKNHYKLLSLVFALFFVTAQVGYSVNTPFAKSDIETTSGFDLNSDASLDNFLSMSNKEMAAVTGKKLSISDKLNLFVAKRAVKKMMKQGMDDAAIIDALKKKGDIDWLGLALGFFLGLLGVLIVYLFLDDSMRRSAWIGCGIWVGLVLIGTVVSVLRFL